MKPVNLQELADAISFFSYDMVQFLHVTTGEIVIVFEKDLRQAEEEESDEEEMDVELAAAMKIINDEKDEFLPLPEQYEVNEYRMMERFIGSMDDEKKQDELEWAIRGRGAFRRFKDKVIQLGVENDWYDFRDNSYLEFARNWCEFKDVAYTE